MTTSQICKDERRRAEVRENSLFGLDFLEVSDDQLSLRVTFLGKAPQLDIKPQQLHIDGGRRIRNIQVTNVQMQREKNPEFDDAMTVTVDKYGDFSTYILRVVNTDGFDPRYDHIDFTFKAGCPSDLDCKSDESCPPVLYPTPEINYLAKDYASFRQLLLDRLALTIPNWQERHIPDIGITLVEVMAYIADYLSYYQDSVATEAYIDTARQRISVRRHTRLVDYAMHEGCNARAWLFLKTDVNLPVSPDLPAPATTTTTTAAKSAQTLTTEKAAPTPPSASSTQTSTVGAEPTIGQPAQPAKPTQPVASAAPFLLKNIYFITGLNNALAIEGTMLNEREVQELDATQYEVFEPILMNENQPLEVYKSHNAIWLYTWDDQECCLPKGATSATLQDFAHGSDPDEAEKAYLAEQIAEYEGQEPPDDTDEETTAPAQGTQGDQGRVLQLKVGDYLLFEEVRGVKTGKPEDADITRRHVVRLTKADKSVDPLNNKNILEIEWAIEDALPISLCISSLGNGPDCTLFQNITIARGNILLVDHGRTVKPAEDQYMVETQDEKNVVIPCVSEGKPIDVPVLAKLFTPILHEAQLTFHQPIVWGQPASQVLLQDPRQALPAITVTSTPPPTPNGEVGKTRTWQVQRDLLASGGNDLHFVVEIDNDRFAHLRFGNDEQGRKPEAGEAFAISYRIGEGVSGNVGAEAISNIVFRNNDKPNGSTLQPRNPFAAIGGKEPEPLTEVKLFAPRAFRSELERAVIADDYAQLAQQHPQVQRAAASLRWTGSGYNVLVAIDPFGTDELNPTLRVTIARYLEKYRRIGHDVTVIQAAYVPLAITMQVLVQPHILRSHVKADLLKRFSNRVLADGTIGFFHPDNLTFGRSIAASELIALAQTIPGVVTVVLQQLERFGEGPNQELQKGVLSIGPIEIAQLDNDLSFPEHGRITFDVRGGR